MRYATRDVETEVYGAGNRRWRHGLPALRRSLVAVPQMLHDAYSGAQRIHDSANQLAGAVDGE